MRRRADHACRQPPARSNPRQTKPKAVKQPAAPAPALPYELLQAVAARCNGPTLRVLALASRGACDAARRAGTTMLVLEEHSLVAQLGAAADAGRLPAVREIVMELPDRPLAAGRMLRSFGRLPALRSLYLRADNAPLDDAAAAALAQDVPGLEAMSSYSCEGLTARGLAALGRLPLTSLNLVGACAEGVAPAGLARLAPTLVDLGLNHCDVDDLGTAAIAQLTALTRLSLDSNYISSDGAAALAMGLPALRMLDLNCNDITTAGAAALASLTALELLDLAGNEQVGDAGVWPLLRCTRLEVLRLYGTRVSGAMLGQLRAGLPRLDELHCDSDTPSEGWEATTSVDSCNAPFGFHGQ